MVLVSVLMGSYNHQKYISEAIESVLNQTFPDLELIIIDDYSTDNSRSIIEQYQAKDERVKAFFHEKNMGIANTINDGLKKVRGKFVSFIGSDDVWFPYKLERQLALIKNHEDQILWSEGEIIDGNGAPTGTTFTKMHLATNKKKSGNLFKEILWDNYIFGQSLLIKKDYIGDTLFDTNLRFLNDYRFIADLARKHDFFFIPEPLAKYRLHAKNSITRDRTRWLEDRILLYSYFLQRYGGEISRNLKGILYMKIGSTYADLGRTDLAKEFYLNAISIDPISRETILYLILTLTDVEGRLGSSLCTFYFKVNSIF
ncbi:MAG: glycosyltransferase [Candidatus Bathyarchaeota archaeon]|nr:glycosyltransferase [Candidatus Bathyarchaeota archaeon]